MRVESQRYVQLCGDATKKRQFCEILSEFRFRKMKRLGSLVVFVSVVTFVELCLCTIQYSTGSGSGKNWMEGVDRGKLDKCSALLEAFARSASNFSHCAVKRARPFKFCCMCSDQYSNILEIKDRIYADVDCVGELVWSEKYQIVERVFEFAKTLWFTSHCQGRVNGQTKPKLFIYALVNGLPQGRVIGD